jgi:nucleosome assembly protein 1-like 1
MVQGRLSSLVGRSSGYIESLDPAVRQRVDGLKGVQAEQSKFETEFQMEVLALEKKYAERYRPLFEQRRRIITGAEEPAKELVQLGQEQSDDEEDEDEEEGEGEKAKATRPLVSDAELAKAPKGIPEFWLTALKNHLGISQLVTERDEEVLKHLVDVRVEYFEKPGFRLVFEFAEPAGEWFSNEGLRLTKAYYYHDQVGYEGDFVYDHAEGTDIQWKEGKDLTVKVETKKQRNKSMCFFFLLVLPFWKLTRQSLRHEPDPRRQEACPDRFVLHLFQATEANRGG